MPKFVNWLGFGHTDCKLEGCIACSLRILSQLYWNVASSDATIADKEATVIDEAVTEVHSRIDACKITT